MKCVNDHRGVLFNQLLRLLKDGFLSSRFLASIVKILRVVSLDLDGTLVSREYVDYFWLELVPRLYAEKHGIDFREAKNIVLREYDKIGPRDLRWYIPEYWFSRFNLDRNLLYQALEEAGRLVKPYEDTLEFLEKAHRMCKLVVCTSASREFVNLVFKRVPLIPQTVSSVFSSVSDFALPGKPREFYERVLTKLNVRPEEVIHVGDDEENDYRIPLSLGIRAVLIDRKGVKGFQNLLELLPIIGNASAP